VPQVEANFGATPFVGDFTGLLAECKERLRERVLAPPLPRRGKVRVPGGRGVPSRAGWPRLRMLASWALIRCRGHVLWLRTSLSGWKGQRVTAGVRRLPAGGAPSMSGAHALSDLAIALPQTLTPAPPRRLGTCWASWCSGTCSTTATGTRPRPSRATCSAARSACRRPTSRTRAGARGRARLARRAAQCRRGARAPARVNSPYVGSVALGRQGDRARRRRWPSAESMRVKCACCVWGAQAAGGRGGSRGGARGGGGGRGGGAGARRAGRAAGGALPAAVPALSGAGTARARGDADPLRCCPTCRCPGAASERFHGMAWVPARRVWVHARRGSHLARLRRRLRAWQRAAHAGARGRPDGDTGGCA